MGKWFELWTEYMQTVMNAMQRNLDSDLAAGYGYNHSIIKNQQSEIADFQRKLARICEQINAMTKEQAERFCRMELLKAGVI